MHNTHNFHRTFRKGYGSTGSNNGRSTFLGRFHQMLWWEPEQSSLPISFCLDTSLHGLKYIGQPKRHFIERLFWFSAFATGTFVAFFLINGVWTKYKHSPIIVSFQNQETKVGQIPFPAITICNVNNILRSKAQHFINIAEQEDAASDVSEEALKNIFYLNHICSSMALSFSQKFGYNANGSTIPKELLDKAVALEASIDEEKGDKAKTQTNVKAFLRRNAQTCGDMIHLCLWQDEEQNCEDIFQEIETDFGKCCTFNMVPQSLMYTFTNDTRDKESVLQEWQLSGLNVDSLLLKSMSPGLENAKFPRRTKQAGSTYGLSFVLNPALHEYFCATADGTGFQLDYSLNTKSIYKFYSCRKLVTHLPTQVPHVVDYGVAIEFNKEVYITVAPDLTTSDVNVEEFSLVMFTAHSHDDGFSYLLASGITLTYKYAVQKRKCYFHGEFNLKYYNYYTESNCQEECLSNLTFLTCQCVRYFMPTDSERQLCPPNKLACTEGIKKVLAQEGLLAGDCKKCLPTCTEINYIATTSTSPIRDDVEIWLQEDGMLSDWARNNISIVHVFFGKGSTYAKIRKELYGFTDLIANTGGLLGLCLGFSALSALEIVYFLTLRAVCVYRSLKRDKNFDESSLQPGRPNIPRKIVSKGIQVIPVPVEESASPYSQFVISELYSYYNTKKNLY